MRRGVSYLLDDTHWPIVYVLTGKGLEKEIREYVRDMVATATGRPGLSYAVFDARVMPAFSAHDRQVLADELHDKLKLFNGRTVGISILLSSALMRGGLTAFMWLVKFPFEVAVLENIDQAVAAAFTVLGKHGAAPAANPSQVLAAFRRLSLTERVG